jgi:hypothetical protein
MPLLHVKLNASFGFLVLPVLATKAYTVFGKIVVVEESPIFTAADKCSRYVWRHSVPCEVFGCGHIMRLAIRVLGDSSTALIPSSLLFSCKILLQIFG